MLIDIDKLIIYTNFTDEKIKWFQIPYTVKVSNHLNGISYILVDWCKIHCKNCWGYYWDNDNNGYIGFEDNTEKILFCMSNDYQRDL